MELLPPVGWADVATKRDLAALEERMELRFQLIDQRFQLVDQKFEWLEARLGERFEAGLRQQVTRFWVALVAVTGLSVGLADALARIA